MAQKNYKPLKSIIELLKEFLGCDKSKQIDSEYSFIKGSVTELINRNCI